MQAPTIREDKRRRHEQNKKSSVLGTRTCTQKIQAVTISWLYWENLNIVLSEKQVMAHKKCHLEVELLCPIPKFKEKPQLTPVFFKAEQIHEWIAWTTFVAPSNSRQRGKGQLIAYVLCAADEQNAYLRTRLRELIHAPLSSILSYLMLSSRSNITNMTVVHA